LRPVWNLPVISEYFYKYMKTDETGSHTIGDIAYAQYIKADINTGITFIRERHQLAGRLFAGIGVPYGNATALPLEQMFYAAGHSMRAWQARTLGPGSMPVDSTFTIPTKQEIYDWKSFGIPVSSVLELEGALFADAGTSGTYPNRSGGRRCVSIQYFTNPLPWT